MDAVESTAVARRGLLPVGVLSSSLPLLVLFGSNTFTSAQIALLQLLLLSVIQVLSSALKLPRKTPSAPAIREPIKVQVVNVPNSSIPSNNNDDDRRKPVDVPDVTAEEVGRASRNSAGPPSSNKSHSRSRSRGSGGAVLESTSEAGKVTVAEDDEEPVRPEHPLYSNEQLDSCLRNFLAVLDPSQLSRLPKSLDPTLLPSPYPIDEWPVMLNTPNSKVAKHPSIPHLYSISASYPDVPLRNLWELMIDIENRPKWDSMCQEASNLDAIGIGPDRPKTRRREASVDYLATKGMFLVKANDMVLLSVNAQLYPTKSRRLVCATTSVEHPLKPPTGSFTRMQLQISGFVAEEDGEGGCRVTQITDLSALGSWVPGRVIKLVTESLIPKSLVKIGIAAKELQIHGKRAALQDDQWLPPLVGSWDPVDTLPVPPPIAKSTLTAGDLLLDDTRSEASTRPLVYSETQSTSNISDDDDNDARSTTSSIDDLPASSARDLRQIVLQLRNMNSRLDSLEKVKVPTAASVMKGTTSDGTSTARTSPGFHPPPAPFGVNKVTENALTSPAQPMGWMSRLAGSIDIGSFVRGIGAGVFSTTTAATIAAILVYFFRKKGFSFTR